MSISSLRLMAAAAAVTGGLAIASGPVAAQDCYPPVPGCGTTVPPVVTPGPTLTLSDRTVFHGQTIRASVTGFQPGTTGIVTIASVEQQIGAFAVGTDGTSSTSVTIPANLTLGGHTVFGEVGADQDARSGEERHFRVAEGYRPLRRSSSRKRR